MGFLSKAFRLRSRVEPYGLWSGDQEQLDRFAERGADITAPREVEFFLEFASDVRAGAAAEDLRVKRIRHELVEPSHDIPEWMLFVRSYGVPLVPDLLRDTIDLCEEIASRHGGEYEGWAALLTDEEKAAN